VQKYISINWNALGRGAFTILLIPSPFTSTLGILYKLPNIILLACSHTTWVLNMDWSPHSDTIITSDGEDRNAFIWW
jgi:coronin-1B/1C/6